MSYPYIWRAEGGYRAETPPQGMVMGSAVPPFMPPMLQTMSFIPSPVGIYGLAQHSPATGPPPQQLCVPPPPPPPPKKPEEEKEEPKKEEPKPKRVSRAPPLLMPGSNYMYPLEHTRIHIFRGTRKVWEPKNQGKQ
jgi:hypothetical protein